MDSSEKPKTAEVETLKHAYYYIDNVTVKQIDSDEDCKCVVNSQSAHTEEYSTLIYTKAIHIEESMTTAERVEAQELFLDLVKRLDAKFKRKPKVHCWHIKK